MATSQPSAVRRARLIPTLAACPRQAARCSFLRRRLLVGAILAYVDHYDANDPTLAEVLHSLLMISWYDSRPQLWKPFNDAIASKYAERMSDCREALWRIIRDGWEDGAIAAAINALVSSCIDDWLTGQWDVWARRVGGELRATGPSASPSRSPGTAQLTHQELEIATLAASGLTNKQIAERLYLSHRTVSSHLYKLFPYSAVRQQHACPLPSCSAVTAGLSADGEENGAVAPGWQPDRRGTGGSVLPAGTRMTRAGGRTFSRDELAEAWGISE